ncbi:MAG: hypothetical protein WCO79_02005 [bacterium]
MKKSISWLLAIALSLVIVFLWRTSTPAAVEAQTLSTPSVLAGHAWSSNIGWVSFNGSNDSGGGSSHAVNRDAAGNLTGYAWSSNIGWIKFGGLDTATIPTVSAAPGTQQINAKVDTSTGRLIGWARACAGMSDPVGCTDAVQSTQVTAGTNGLSTSSSQIILNWQIGLFEQQVYVTNNTSTTLPGLRITLESSLPSGTTLYFANTDSNGKFYLQHNYPISPGQTVHIVAEYLNLLRNMPQTPLNFSAQALNQAILEPVLPVGSTLINTIPSSSILYPNNAWTTLPHKLIFWSTSSLLLGEKIAIQYSDDNGVTWPTYFGKGMSIHVIDAPTPNVVDYGAPHTMVPPPENRMYKVYKLPVDTYPARDGGSTYNPSLTTLLTLPSTIDPRGGWRGWISLSSTADSGNYGVQLESNGQYSGYAWGSDVIGWMQFTPTVPGGGGGGPTCPGVCETAKTLSLTCATRVAESTAGSWTWTATISSVFKGTAPYTFSWIPPGGTTSTQQPLFTPTTGAPISASFTTPATSEQFPMVSVADTQGYTSQPIACSSVPVQVLLPSVEFGGVAIPSTNSSEPTTPSSYRNAFSMQRGKVVALRYDVSGGNTDDTYRITQSFQGVTGDLLPSTAVLSGVQTKKTAALNTNGVYTYTLKIFSKDAVNPKTTSVVTVTVRNDPDLNEF